MGWLHYLMGSEEGAQAVTYPKEGEDAVLHYKTTQKEFPVPYVLYVDFESFLIPSAGKGLSANMSRPDFDI